LRNSLLEFNKCEVLAGANLLALQLFDLLSGIASSEPSLNLDDVFHIFLEYALDMVVLHILIDYLLKLLAGGLSEMTRRLEGTGVLVAHLAYHHIFRGLQTRLFL
jgi:hypothetical protein